MTDATPKTLAERLLAITAEMPAIKATGKSPFSKEPALSIEDVEDAVRPLLVKHRVGIRFCTRQLIRADKEWIAEITAIVVPVGEAASDTREDFVDDWADTGSTPAAAYSFARKSYLKQLFHIAGEDDSASPHNGHQGAPETHGDGTTNARQTERPKAGKGSLCPFCAEQGWLSSTKLNPTFWPAERGPHQGKLQCNGRTPDGGYANHLAPLAEGEEIDDPTSIPY